MGHGTEKCGPIVLTDVLRGDPPLNVANLLDNDIYFGASCHVKRMEFQRQGMPPIGQAVLPLTQHPSDIEDLVQVL